MFFFLFPIIVFILLMLFQSVSFFFLSTSIRFFSYFKLSSFASFIGKLSIVILRISFDFDSCSLINFSFLHRNTPFIHVCVCCCFHFFLILLHLHFTLMWFIWCITLKNALNFSKYFVFVSFKVFYRFSRFFCHY